ncbi:hypothetical protein H0H93_006945 [Arthromyces matolae]|nr:hypothetical protein H0H93_006945 [Arthromyces matolae]
MEPMRHIRKKRVIYDVISLPSLELGRKRRWIERNWSGTGPSQITTHHSTGKDVHRIKVDEKAGYIITTSSTGGLQVTDLREDRELWSLPDVSELLMTHSAAYGAYISSNVIQSHVRPYAHCEYGEGFVIWDYLDGSKEVWRRVEDWNEEEAALVIPEAMPTPRLRRVYGVAAEK